MCFIIYEKHHNLLEYKESSCTKEEDLNTLCSLVEDYNRTLLKRKNSSIRCPFWGSRLITYASLQDGECSDPPSTLVSERNDTVLQFSYNHCPGQSHGNAIPQPNRLECLASWQEGDIYYLLGKFDELPASGERYSCFTYKEVENEDYRYLMSQTGTDTCGELNISAEKTYKVYDESIAPGQPYIDGFGPVIRVTEGYSLQLKCISLGGSPPANLRWTRNDYEIPARPIHYAGRSESILDIEVTAFDEGAEYRCEAMNIASVSPLSVSTILIFAVEQCELSSGWVGRWYEVDTNRLVDITQREFSNNICTAALGQSYLLKNEKKNCNRCVQIMEKHPNILQYRKSKCKPVEGLNELCSALAEEVQTLVRHDVNNKCPFSGSRSFSYQPAAPGGCINQPSRLLSQNEDTELLFLFNPCPDQSNADAALYPETVKCIAGWVEGSTRYFMGFSNSWRWSRENRYRCFTMKEHRDGRQVFKMTTQESHRCIDMDDESTKTYTIFDLSEAPSEPIIEMEGGDDLLEGGSFVQLMCITYGGFPIPDLTWFLNGEEFPSKTSHLENERHEAHINVFITPEEVQKGNYQCQVSNFARNWLLNATTIPTSDAASPVVLYGPEETHLTIVPSERAVLNCTAAVATDLSMRWTYISGNSVIEIASMNSLVHYDNRYRLDIDVRPEEVVTHYNLIIDPAWIQDSGIYECTMSDRSQIVSHRTYLTIKGTPKYETCEFPDHWNGKWDKENHKFEIRDNSINDQKCLLSFGNKYLLKNEYDGCNYCFLIDEKHPNLLRIKGSECLREDDLSMLCSMVKNDWKWMMKLDSTVQCPFTGSRTFTFQIEYGGCSERPSKLYSRNNDRELLFLYNPCPDQNNPNIIPYPRKVECLATWREGATHYLIGRWEKLDHRERFVCYTYEEVKNERYLYSMSHAGTPSCAPLNRRSETSYKVFDESVAPGKPQMQGYDTGERKKVGDTIQLTCISRGGFPPPLLKWFKDGTELATELHQEEGEGKTSAHIKIVLQEGDEEGDYRCEASNFAVDTPLTTSIILRPFVGVVTIMKPQVLAVEGQSVFLPCAHISDKELEMEWFDADLDMILTSGVVTLGYNGTAIKESNYMPYIKDNIFGLIIKSGFLDTKYSCSVGEEKIGNTTLVILPSFFIREETYETSDYFEETGTEFSINENSIVSLNCTLKTGITPSVISWRKNAGAKLLTQDDFNLAEEDGYTLGVDSQSYLLSISDAQASHSGSYVCQVILNDLEVYSQNFDLTVQDVIKGNLSGDTQIPCHAPAGMKVTFLKNEEVIEIDSQTSNKYEFERDAKEDGSMTTLIIKQTSEEDGGLYVCLNREVPQEVLKNVFVGFSSEVMLNVTSVRIVEVLGTQVSLEWDSPTEDLLAEIKEYEVTYFERGHDDEAFSVITKNETVILPFLDEETEYGFQVRVKTSMGWGAFSKPVYKRTGKDIEEDLVITTPVTVDEEEVMTSTVSSADALDHAEELEKEYEDRIPEYTTEGGNVTLIDEKTEFIYSHEDYEEEEEEDEKSLLPTYKKVALPCSNITDLEHITWKRGEHFLFLGRHDLAGIHGLSISPVGELILNEGAIEDLRDNDTYTCYMLDLLTFEDVAIVAYHISLNEEETVIKVISKKDDSDILEAKDSNDLKFDLEDEVAVLANSERVGKKIVEVLQNGGLKVRLLDISRCNATDIRGWDKADKALQMCEQQARISGDLADDESIFMGVDFFVKLPPSNWFAVTQLYLHNIEKDVSLNVFAPMIPVPAANITQPADSEGPVLIEVSEAWWNTVQGVDKSEGSGLKASILSLQESYLNLINGQGEAS